MNAVLELLGSSPTAFIITCLVFGLAIGSFLNVVIYRVPIILERQWREQCQELAASGPPADHRRGRDHGAATDAS